MELTHYARRKSHAVRIGSVIVGDEHPIAVQSMTNTDTNNVAASVAQIERIDRAGGKIVRLTAQGKREGEALGPIVAQLRTEGFSTAIVADIHFLPEVAAVAAKYVDKVRINPGNYRLDRGELEALIAQCKERGVALRIGVNHGSLAKRVFDEYGDTPEGMVFSAMEFLRICRREAFDQVVVSMKSSNTRVMVAAYRLLVEAMEQEGMTYPIHLGVTEAGNGLEGRIKSAVGIGALLADGIGDTIRVSLTEAPENEIPTAQLLADYFTRRAGRFTVEHPERYSSTVYRRRSSVQIPVVHDEDLSGFRILEAVSENPTAELRAAILNLEVADEPVVVRRRYADKELEQVAVKAAADLGPLLLDGLADGIWIDAPEQEAAAIREVELMILQAARVRFSHTEYIACPSCGRTLYDIETTLAEIRSKTSHLKNLRIGVMGCIVNGPGEMADADYGYVGAAPGRITLYKGRQVIEKNIPQEEALDRLIALIKANGDWIEP
ncbi:MAG: (E)-4-hydroxy-3-methylbut-2-enyl-diphosphate synthase [Rikenellaceae bacterium]|nr:(E)-4-hydroxy-3-methylbut-2-enyl-diphosphate synthase [Rikenellaceae bacterium]